MAGAADGANAVPAAGILDHRDLGSEVIPTVLSKIWTFSRKNTSKHWHI